MRHARVQAESHIRTPAAAEAVLAAGHADMVSIVRGQIADPHLVAKARAGRPDDVRPCISCNQLCWGRRSRDYWISCLVNPSAGREFEWGGDRFEPAAVPRQVLVVGGGPAGLETARVAAERGHAVTLLERGDALGGQFRLAGLQPSRGQITDLLAWHARRLDALGVDVRLGVEATADDVAAIGADEVVVATGSRPPGTGFQRALPMVDRLPGVDGADVVAIQDVLDGAAVPGAPRPGPRRPRRLARPRHGPPSRRSRARRDDPHCLAGRRRRALPQRRRRTAPQALWGGRRAEHDLGVRHRLAGWRRPRPLDRDRRTDEGRRRQPRHRRDAGRRDGTRRRPRDARHRVPPDRRLLSRRAGRASRSTRVGSWLVGSDRPLVAVP